MPCRFILLITVLLPLSLQAKFVREVGFDTTEGWAMKYFSAVAMMQGSGPPLSLGKGEWALGFEIANIPHLDKEQRTVGFGGTKEEDLNKAPILARPLLHYGITDRLSITASYVPPVKIFGRLSTHLVGGSLNFDLIRKERMIWTIRTVGQWSKAEGDFTVWEEIAGNPDPEINPFESIAPSEDIYKSWNVTLDTTFYWRIKPQSDTWLFLNASYTYGDYNFDVDVPQANENRHQRYYHTEGYLKVFSIGFDTGLTERFSLRGSVAYSPLDVERPPDYEVESDDMVNFRLIFNYML